MSFKLPVTIDGEGDETLFFIHGWPDTEAVWEQQVAHFKNRYRCARITMPHYAGRGNDKTPGANPRGYSFLETAELLREAILSISQNPNPEAVTLVIHDWGCFWGFVLQMKYPELVKGIVAMDVGHPSTLKSRAASVVIFSGIGLLYQWWLALAYMISRFTPLGLGKSVGDALVFAVLYLCILSTSTHPQKAVILKNANADMGYPYFYVYQVVYSRALGLSAGYNKLLKRKGPYPSCPCLFLYGENKSFMFHSGAFTKELRRREGCGAEGVPAGHWLQLEAPEIVNEKMEVWLEDLLG